MLVQTGLCVPTKCTALDLSALNHLYKKAVETSGLIADPTDPIYTFPSEQYNELYTF